MFGAIGKYFRALGYLFSGRVDEARRTLNENPTVVRATYEQIIAEKQKRIQQYKDAVSAMIAQEEKKRAMLRQLTEEVQKLAKLREGAAAAARRLVAKYAGNAEAVKADPEYARFQAAFKDFSSTLAEKEARCKELEDDLAGLTTSIAQHKRQLEGLLRELEQLRQEKHEAVADMMTAKEEQEAADLLAGIAEDRTAQELQELRDQRAQAKARARVSREMAGMDTRATEDEFIEYAEREAASTEFDALIGLAQQPEAPTAEPPEKTKLPEA